MLIIPLKENYMKRNTKSMFAAVLLAVVFTTPPFAIGRSQEASNKPSRDVAMLRAEDAREAVEAKKQELKTKKAEKLDDIKLKVCEKRLAGIKKIMTSIQERATRQIDVFNKISERTQKFYVDKAYTVAGYDDLVKTVNDKKEATEAVAQNVAAFGADFTCSSDNAGSFKADVKAQLQAQNDALKDYKTAVKNLIVAVKSANSNDKQEAQQ